MSRAGSRLAAAAVALLAVGCLAEPDPSTLAAPIQPREASPVSSEDAELVELRRDSVSRHARAITLRVRNRSCFGVGSGSGFAIAEDLLVTNRHVVENAEVLQVTTWDGRTLDVDVAEVAMGADLAVVRVDGTLPAVADLADRRPGVGDDVTAAGYPGGRELTLSDGQVVGYARGAGFANGEDVMRVDADVRPGSSGGPLLAEDGTVTGVVYAIEVGDDYGLALPVGALRDVLDRGALFRLPSC